MKASWSRRAELDLYAIGDYIARDDPEAAERWIERIVNRANKVAAMPQSGRRVPEYGRDDVRELFLGAYRIVYLVEPRGIRVLLVREGHEQLPNEPDSE